MWYTTNIVIKKSIKTLLTFTEICGIILVCYNNMNKRRTNIMSKIFIATEDNFQREYDRYRAHGYTKLVIDSDVQTSTPVELVSEGDTLRVKATVDDGSEPEYMILCKEFGCMGYTQKPDEKFRSKVSIITLDKEDNMLVTLHEGAILVNIDGKIMMPSVKTENPPKGTTNDIYWINLQWILSHQQYLPHAEQKFYYDFERYLIVGGGQNPVQNTYLSSATYRELPEQTVDMSKGKYGLYLQSEQAREDAKEAKKAMNTITSAIAQTPEFDEDDEEWTESEEEDDDDDFDEV